MGRPLFSYSNNLGDKNLLNCSSARISVQLQWTGNNKLVWEKCHHGKYHLSRHKKIKRKIQSNVVWKLNSWTDDKNTPKRKDKSSPFAIFKWRLLFKLCLIRWKLEDLFQYHNQSGQRYSYTTFRTFVTFGKKKKADALTYRVFNLHLEQLYIASLVWIRTAHYILLYW